MSRSAPFTVLGFVRITLLAVALGVGAYLRFEAARSLPFSGDDYAQGLQTLGIMKTGLPSLPSGIIPKEEPIALAYIMSVIWRLTGPSLAIARLFNVVVGTLTIYLAYRLARRLGGHVFALIFAILMATNVWSIAVSGVFRSYALAELGAVITCHLAVSWLRSTHSWKTYVRTVALVAIIAVTTHYLLLPLVGLVALMPVLPWLGRLITRRFGVALTAGATHGSASRKAIAFITLDGTTVAVLLGLGLALGLLAVVLFYTGTAPLFRLANLIIGEDLFLRLQPGAQLTFKPFYLATLYQFYGPGLGLAALTGIFIMLRAGTTGLFLVLVFVGPLLLLSTTAGWFYRYIFPFNIVLLLAVTYFVSSLYDACRTSIPKLFTNRWQTTGAWIGASVLIIFLMALAVRSDALILRYDGVQSTEQLARWLRGSTEPRAPSYQRVAAYLREHMTDGDVLLTTRPAPFAFELPAVPGYWLMGAPLDLRLAGIKDGAGNLINVYAGYPAITTRDGFLDLLRGSQIWVVIPYVHDNQAILPSGVWAFVRDQFSLIEEASDATIAVYLGAGLNLVPIGELLEPKPYGNAYQAAPLPDGAVAIASKPGAVNWAGVLYKPDEPIDLNKIVFRLRVKLVELSATADGPQVNFIAVEPDGDRWHIGPRKLDPGDQWQEFFISFSELRFWSLGPGTQQPHQVTEIRVEFSPAKEATFTAQVKVQMVTTKDTGSL